jgi:hypothetical protein
VTIAVALLVLATMVAIGAAVVFQRRMTGEIDALLADAHAPRSEQVEERDIARLPAPVQRWLRYSRVIGTISPATARLRQEGEFNLGRGWMPFSAEQYFTINPPGFVWKASFRMAPMMSVVGRDQYRAGVASIDMRILSLVPVAKKSGGGLNQGDLLRFLGEMQWFPAAALSPFVSWDALDDRSARATMADAGISASMTFRFGADGRLLEESAIRYNDARERNETWVNRNDSDREFGGIRVPAVGEARWEYDTGPFPYIRWTITDLEQDRAVPYSR